MWVYRVGLLFMARFHPKAKEFLKGRQEQRLAWEKIFSHHAHRIIWLHCASLGEFEQGRPIIEACRRAYPRHKLLLTFFSPSGYQLRKNYEHADWVLYLPLDSPQQAEQLVRWVRPELALFVKYEFWYYYLSELHKQQIPTILFAAIFRPSQLFFKPYGNFFRKMLHFFSEIHVQDESSRQLLANIGVTHVTVSGDTRIDRVAQIADAAASVDAVADFVAEEPVIVMGSIWQKDWEVVSRDVQILHKHYKFIVVPHEINERFLQTIEQTLGTQNCIRYSAISPELTHKLGAYRALLIDKIGLLSSLYLYAQIAYIGGGFKEGLHNILEPAAFGVPVVFGNRKYHPFREAKELLAQGGARTIAKSGQFADIVSYWLNNRAALQNASAICKDYVQYNRGATQQIMESISRYLR
ncbi:MAG: glycosyltransferase N-terminal domain-containing protein [Cytophagales bacterium]|nr:3-deoxy-D-manno-octulosonic acid transferase [Bernardetiaceae bacterium]MDW8205311.1 glycosyltransferase N-terminal domain-containing protein [Cytophagales bacterium]